MGVSLFPEGARGGVLRLPVLLALSLPFPGHSHGDPESLRAKPVPLIIAPLLVEKGQMLLRSYPHHPAGASIEVSPVCLPVGFVLLEKLLSWHENTE